MLRQRVKPAADWLPELPDTKAMRDEAKRCRAPVTMVRMRDEDTAPDTAAPATVTSCAVR